MSEVKMYKVDEEAVIKKNEENFKKTIDKSDLSLTELQLKELIEMRKDIHTISTIVFIWFILGLIGLLISIITWMALSP